MLSGLVYLVGSGRGFLVKGKSCTGIIFAPGNTLLTDSGTVSVPAVLGFDGVDAVAPTLVRFTETTAWLPVGVSCCVLSHEFRLPYWSLKFSQADKLSSDI